MRVLAILAVSLLIAPAALAGQRSEEPHTLCKTWTPTLQRPLTPLLACLEVQATASDPACSGTGEAYECRVQWGLERSFTVVTAGPIAEMGCHRLAASGWNARLLGCAWAPTRGEVTWPNAYAVPPGGLIVDLVVEGCVSRSHEPDHCETWTALRVQLPDEQAWAARAR